MRLQRHGRGLLWRRSRPERRSWAPATRMRPCRASCALRRRCPAGRTPGCAWASACTTSGATSRPARPCGTASSSVLGRSCLPSSPTWTRSASLVAFPTSLPLPNACPPRAPSATLRRFWRAGRRTRSPALQRGSTGLHGPSLPSPRTCSMPICVRARQLAMALATSLHRWSSPRRSRTTKSSRNCTARSITWMCRASAL
mmetsp:Transcript_40737/g.110152  ORF Transcript_40737/g.110152 Transcript_40737/m.110152 type:complete len:200 (+) Transcript_40737:80-679(+)